MKWPTDFDRLIRGSRDLRTQKDADAYLLKLWQARVRRHGKSNVMLFRGRRRA
jgi:hypothetical protein